MSSTTLTIPPGSGPAAIISALRKHYVETPRDLHVRNLLDTLLARDDDGRHQPIPARFGSECETRGMIVIGESGAGKTTTLAHILRTHPAFAESQEPAAEAERVGPILKLDVPSPTTLKSLGLKIIEKTTYNDVSRSRTEAEVWEMVRQRLSICGVCILWLDEAQDVMRSGSESEVTYICNTLKTLCKGDHAVVVILSGIEALATLPEFDPQIDSRFSKLWLDEVSPTSDAKGIWRLLQTYCSAAGLEAPARGDLIERLFHSCRNRLGKSIERIIDAIELALFNGDTALTIDHFAQAYALKEGCRSNRNIFIVDKWASISTKKTENDEYVVPKKRRRRSSGKKRAS